MTVPETPAAGRDTRPSRCGWLKAGLVVSLAFNLFVIGAVSAHRYWWEHHRHHGLLRGPAFTQLLPRPFFFGLADKRRDELRMLMRAHRQEFFDGRGRMRLAARDVADALDAQPFDQARFDKALQAFAATGHTLIDTGAEVVADVVGHLTPDEKKKLGEQLLHAARRDPPPGDDKN